jgi:hypothetical protein
MTLKNGSRGDDVRELQKALKSLGYNCGYIDGDFGTATEIQVEKFQEDNDLYSDGIVGSLTMSTMNEQLTEDLKFKIDGHPDPEEPVSKMKWVRVDADKVGNGYDRFDLREDVAKAYNNFRRDVLALGGIITSAGSKRPLRDSKRSKSRSVKSLHYTGLAFDMALSSGMNNPKKDRYVIEEVGNREWNVWCKTEDESVPVRKVTGYTYHHTRVVVEDRMFSITELARQHGFEPIKARRYFMRGGHYAGAEWWHFQHEGSLKPGISTFGGELLKIYTMEKCRAFGPWEQTKNAVWQKNWF